MKLSSRARYALRAMMVIARESKGGRPVNLGVVARETSISRAYLEQVAISLKNAGLLKGFPGKNGGHLLARPAGDIRLGSIVEAAIGPVNIVGCIGDPAGCPRSGTCDIRPLYSLINGNIREAFNAFTLADLAGKRVAKLAARRLATS